MVVRSITARQNRKTGRVAITFEIDRETWAGMGRAAESGAHPDTLDYIAGALNTAFLEDAPEPVPVPEDSPLGLTLTRLVPFLAMADDDEGLLPEGDLAFLNDLVERWTLSKEIAPAELERAGAIMARVEGQGGGDLDDGIPF